MEVAEVEKYRRQFCSLPVFAPVVPLWRIHRLGDSFSFFQCRLHSLAIIPVKRPYARLPTNPPSTTMKQNVSTATLLTFAEGDENECFQPSPFRWKLSHAQRSRPAQSAEQSRPFAWWANGEAISWQTPWRTPIHETVLHVHRCCRPVRRCRSSLSLPTQ